MKAEKTKLPAYTEYVTKSIETVCKQFGPRYCGTEAETKAQMHMKTEYERYADEAKVEAFSTHPAALVGVTQVDAVLLTLATVTGLFRLYWASLLLVILAFAVLILEFGLYKEFTDFIFPKKTSHNCFAVRRASGETKRRIIFAGHMDSSPEWHPIYYGGRVLLFFTMLYAFFGLLYQTALTVTGLCGSGAADVMRLIALAFLPGYIMLFFFRGKPYAEGANDNLTGVFCSAAVLKYLADNDIRFEHTEVIAMATGGEESGLRGAKAYMKAHAEKFKTDGTETVFIAVDTVRDYDCQFVYQRDMSGITKHDESACRLLQKGGERAGIKLDFSSVYLGASDAAAVTQAGVKATAYAAMDPGPPRYYHTRLDTWDNLVPETIEKGVEVLLNTAFLFDEQGLKDHYT